MGNQTLIKNQLSRETLLGCVNHLEGGPSLVVPFMIARNMDTTDELGGEANRPVMLTEQDTKCLACALISFTILYGSIQQFRQDGIDRGDLTLCIGNRVFSQVKAE